MTVSRAHLRALGAITFVFGWLFGKSVVFAFRIGGRDLFETGGFCWLCGTVLFDTLEDRILVLTCRASALPLSCVPSMGSVDFWFPKRTAFILEVCCYRKMSVVIFVASDRKATTSLHHRSLLKAAGFLFLFLKTWQLETHFKECGFFRTKRNLALDILKNPRALRTVFEL